MITHNPNAPPIPHAANRKERRALKAEPQEEPKPGKDEPTPPKQRRFVPPPCTSCAALANGKNYSEVYHKRNQDGMVIRYCRCRFCPNTWKVVEPIGASID